MADPASPRSGASRIHRFSVTRGPGRAASSSSVSGTGRMNPIEPVCPSITKARRWCPRASHPLSDCQIVLPLSRGQAGDPAQQHRLVTRDRARRVIGERQILLGRPRGQPARAPSRPAPRPRKPAGSGGSSPGVAVSPHACAPVERCRVWGEARRGAIHQFAAVLSARRPAPSVISGKKRERAGKTVPFRGASPRFTVAGARSQTQFE